MSTGGDPTTVGIVGLGVISGAYLATLSGASAVRVAAVADLDPTRAAEVAASVPGARPLSPESLYADPGIDLVLNLTTPAAHAEVALAALAAGKDVFGEKPLGADLSAGTAILDAAAAAGRRVGCAPDTVLGTGVQTARAAVEAGLIGRPVSAAATWLSPRHEHWHPNPDYYYLEGGGPVLDMGPYYLTSLVHLLGPVAWVQGAGSRARSTRVIGTGPRAGEQIPVDVDTHVTGVLGHVGGALSTVTFSFDAVASTSAPIEVHGDEGVLVVPDPNGFGGEVMHLRRGSGQSWTPLPASAGYAQAGRGVGLIDFAAGAERASGALALHVLEVMTALTAGSSRRIPLAHPVAPPPLVPLTPRTTWHGGTP